MGGSKKICWGLCGCAFVYFVCFPGDIATLGAPFDELARAASKPVNTILKLSNSVSPWLYGAVFTLVKKNQGGVFARRCRCKQGCLNGGNSRLILNILFVHRLRFV